MSTTVKTVSYKGRPYRLLWEGATKYGQRAHLAFLDGSKDFWVDAKLLSSSTTQTHAGSAGTGARAGAAAGAETRTCWECGRRFTRADARRNGGDWGDSYCGC